MNVAALTYEQYMANQDSLRGWLMAGINRCKLELAEVEYSIRDGLRIPIVLLDKEKPIGLMVCELDEDALHVTCVAGDNLPGDWKETVRTVLYNLAEHTGKHTITGNGRCGWQRYLRKYGITVDGEEITHVIEDKDNGRS